MKPVARYQIFFLAVLCLFCEGVLAQANLEVYGQNRVQYRKFAWKYFDTKHFRIYFYDRAGVSLARYVAEEAENNVSVVEKKLGGQFPKRFNIVLYNNYDEYRQTNIGLKDESQLKENTPAGTIDLVGDKLVVYFTGEHTDLKHQIRAGMSRVVMERMLFGDNFKKMVKNALLLNLPPWVTDGYISYLVDGWDAKANTAWKSLLEARPEAGFFELSNDYPELAGKAFWKFVSEQYGNETVKNLLYTMQTKTSLNKGMKEPTTLHLNVRKAYDSCIHFYKNVYAADAKHQELPDSSKGITEVKVPKDNMVVRNIMVSPRGKDIAYVAWKDGEYSVYIQRAGKERMLTLLLDGGRKDLTEQTDPNYPLMAWSSTGSKLAILYKSGNKTRLRIYNSLKGKIENYVIPGNRFDRVLGMTFMEQDDKIVFSAIKKSETDLYVFTIKGSKMTNITNDAWDDIEPCFVSGGGREGILFLSNRPKAALNVPLGVNELPTGPMNVFFYNTKSPGAQLMQLTDVESGHISQPIQYGLDNVAYLYDSNGIQNKYVVLFARNGHNMDSAYSVPITNYAENIIAHQYNLASNEVADVVQEGDEYHVYFHPLQMPGVNATPKVLQPTLLSLNKSDTDTGKTKADAPFMALHHAEPEEPAKPEIKSGSAFQSEFTDDTSGTAGRQNPNNIFNANRENAATDSSTLQTITDSAYVKMKPANYKLSFRPDAITVRADNSILFTQYQSFATNGGQYSNPPVSALATINLNELMENYRVTAGFQLPVNLTGSAYFLQYQNFTHRLDWGILYLRSQSYYNYLVTYVDNTNTPVLQKEQLGKTVTNMVQGDFSYPLDRVRSIRFHEALRQDKLILKAQDTLSLSYDLPNNVQYWSLGRLEYVFDNTISPELNIRFGFRYKFYAEYMYQLSNGNTNCYNLGLDFRSYQNIYKHFIWATRLAYAHSDGSSEVVYYLGGVDNWMSPKYDNYVPTNGNYGFQTVATSMRGYDQNAANGNNFAVLNTELRLPVLTTFVHRPIQSALLKNLQVVAFTDAGSAWRGFLPNATNTSTNYTFPTVGNPGSLNNVFLNLTVPGSSGLKLGYGGGLRTTLLGYFVRCDFAWNIDGIKKPVMYIALGTDF
jgi:hypothetical protein